MRKLLLISLLVLAIGVIGCAKEAEARPYRDPCDTPLASILNACIEDAPVLKENREAFDYGGYLHMILWEDEARSWSIGVWNTYEIQRDEFTSLLGGTIYFNRLFWQKEGE